MFKPTKTYTKTFKYKTFLNLNIHKTSKKYRFLNKKCLNQQKHSQKLLIQTCLNKNI